MSGDIYIYKKVLLIIFLLYSFSVFSKPLNQCVAAFEKDGIIGLSKKWVDTLKAVVFLPVTKGLVPSRLLVEDSMAIMSAVEYSQNQKAFIENHIRDKRVLEIASGGFTELSGFLLGAGAKAVVSMDFVPLRSGQNERLYIKGNIKEEIVIQRIKEKLGDGADTIIVTSVFGAIGYKETKKWLMQLFIVARPRGAVFLDFLLYENLPVNITRESFESILDSMTERLLVKSWKRAEDVNTVSYEYQTLGRSRPDSVSYKVVIR